MKLGKRPARPGAVSLKLNKYVNLSVLPTPPDEFGDENLVLQGWGMLGNDTVGDCVFAGAAHETMLWNRAAGNSVFFTPDSIVSDYSAVTGYVKGNSSTDRGTDIQLAAAYRQKTGILDMSGNRHTIGAYVAVDPGNIELLLSAVYLFEAVGIGINFPDSAMSQFNSGMHWHVQSGAKIEGGHYVPLVARRQGMFSCVTWAALQQMDDPFLSTYNDEILVYVSNEMLSGGKTLEGFDAEQLSSDLQAIRNS